MVGLRKIEEVFLLQRETIQYNILSALGEAVL